MPGFESSMMISLSFYGKTVSLSVVEGFLFVFVVFKRDVFVSLPSSFSLGLCFLNKTVRCGFDL